MEQQTFAGFILGAAKCGIREAKCLALYVGKRTDTIREIRAHIESARHAGKIADDYAAQLSEYVQACYERYEKRGRLVDRQDKSDWVNLGHGGRMRVNHRPLDCENADSNGLKQG